ncbi:L,D-transpeptidase family protein [Faunimonas sp. B44]|uniref:L,D-transpeptidase family protein n=1 Tax=Faunimonas sp. B44 TaxID=3461493 RepID=UPI0040443B1A
MRTSNSRHRLLPALIAAALSATLLASCNDMTAGMLPKHLAPLPSAMKSLIAANGMEERSPILIRIFKEENVLEVWKKQKATGHFALLKSYDICAWSGKLGPKIKEGDRQAPEGFYTITPAQMNPNSSYYLSFNLGFPNQFDQSHGRTGKFLMVHGACSSAGCYAMTDEQIAEIYAMARLAFDGGQRSFQVQAYPFRMTPENLAKHRGDPNMPFWKMLKEGHDHFEVTGQEPKVDVCSRRYVFNAAPVAGVKFSPAAACPPMSVPDPIRVAVSEKAAKDEAKTQIIVAKLEANELKKMQKDQAPQSGGSETLLAGIFKRSGSGPANEAMPSVMAYSKAAQGGSPPVVTAALAPAEPGTTGSVARPAAAARPEAAQVAAAPAPAEPVPVANAYAATEASESSGGFFGRVWKKVNPF